MTRTDEDLKRDIVDQLYWDSRIDASKVKVTVDNGRVTLTGEVPAYGDRSVAISAARSIVGIREVEEHLTVRFASPAPTPGDAEMQSGIESILSWDPAIDESAISVSVSGGVVALEGSVDAHWKKAYVESKLAGIRGAMHLENRLAVVPTETVDDERIAAEIMAALKRDSLLHSEEVTVEVDHGVVTLEGKVPVWPAIDSAAQHASRTRGVVDVHNHLQVIA